MEHNVAGSFIINYLSILDKYFPDKKTWNKFLDSDHKKLLLAYRHLRLSFSHSSEGSRIDPSKIKDKNNPKLEDRFGFADEFDEIQENSNFMIQSIKKIGDFKIKATLFVFAETQRHLDEIIGYAIQNTCTRIGKENQQL